MTWPEVKMADMTTHILALETSSHVCGVALLSHSAEGVRLFADQHDATAEHAERLLPMVDHVLAQAGVARNNLAAVAFGQGPGGFTGLRVACGVAQGIAFGLGLPVLPVDSLMAAATQDVVVQAIATDSTPSFDRVRVLVQDARMNEVYLGVYRSEPGQSGWVTEQPPLLVAVSDLPLWLQRFQADFIRHRPGVTLEILGDALAAFPDLSAQLHDVSGIVIGASAVRATASAVAWLGWQHWQHGRSIPPDRAAPLYVRDKIAFTTQERALGQGGNPRAMPLSTIEPMTPDHLEQVALIEQRVQVFPWTRGNFADALRAGYPAWVIQSGGHVQGFYVLMCAPDVAHLLVIATDPDMQRKGLGSRLLAHCIDQTRAHGLASLILEVRPSNTTALAFYHRHGFDRLSVRKGYYPAADGGREDACVLQKTVV